VGKTSDSLEEPPCRREALCLLSRMVAGLPIGHRSMLPLIKIQSGRVWLPEGPIEGKARLPRLSSGALAESRQCAAVGGL